MLLTFSTPRWRRLCVQSRVGIHTRWRTRPSKQRRNREPNERPTYTQAGSPSRPRTTPLRRRAAGGRACRVSTSESNDRKTGLTSIDVARKEDYRPWLGRGEPPPFPAHPLQPLARAGVGWVRDLTGSRYGSRRVVCGGVCRMTDVSREQREGGQSPCLSDSWLR